MMPARFWVLTLAFFVFVALVAVPLGRYMHRVFAGESRVASRVIGPVERLIYRLSGVSPEREHTWREYALAVLAFSCVTQIFAYVVMRAQGALPWNPTKLGGVPPWLAWNTATSFGASQTPSA